MDEIDQAQALEAEHIAHALAARKVEPKLPARGACHYCDEAVDGARLFCDSDCEQGWQAERRLRAQIPRARRA